METLTSLANPYAMRVDRKRMPNNAMYIVIVLESGLRKVDAMSAKVAKLRK